MIQRACYVACDACGAAAEISCDDADDARLLARGDGYVRKRIDGKLHDLCPRHKNETAFPYIERVRVP